MLVNHCERNKKKSQLSICDFQGSYRVMGIQTAFSSAKCNKLWETKGLGCLHSLCLGKTQLKVHLLDLLSGWLIRGWPKHKASGHTDHGSDHTTAANYPVAEVATENIKCSPWSGDRGTWGPTRARPAFSSPALLSQPVGQEECPLSPPQPSTHVGDREWRRTRREKQQLSHVSDPRTGSQEMHRSMPQTHPHCVSDPRTRSQEMHSIHDPQVKFLADDFKKSFGP